jgi:hypothetical protein
VKHATREAYRLHVEPDGSDAIIARCAKIAKEECERFINPYSAALIADRITARADEIKRGRPEERKN